MHEQEIQKAKDLLRQHRVRQNFDTKYLERGGVTQLLRMVSTNETLYEISKWFGITSSRLSVILPDILDMTYSEYLQSKNISRSGITKSE